MTTTSSDEAPVDALTPRQEQVIRLIAAGRSNPEIATELQISIDGVRWHVSEITSKLAVANRGEAFKECLARKRGARTRKLGRFAAIAVGLAGAVAAAGVVVVAVTGPDPQIDDTAPASAIGTPTTVPEPVTPAAAAIGLTPDELLERMEAAILAGGEIFHVTSTTSRPGSISPAARHALNADRPATRPSTDSTGTGVMGTAR